MCGYIHIYTYIWISVYIHIYIGNVCIYISVYVKACIVSPSPVTGWARAAYGQASQFAWTPRREFAWQTYWFYGFPPKVVIMTHHGWIWQDRLLGEEVANQFAAVRAEGRVWLLTPPKKQNKKEKYIPVSPRRCLSSPSHLLGCLVSQCVDMDVWICYRHNGLPVLLY